MARPRSEKVQQLKRHLLSRIEEGYSRPGDRFLSNRALSTQFGISYQTAHRLIAELEQEGHLLRNLGSGTYVAGDSKVPQIVDFILNSRAKEAGTFGHYLKGLIQDTFQSRGIPFAIRYATEVVKLEHRSYPVLWECGPGLERLMKTAGFGMLLDEMPPTGIENPFVDSVEVDDFAGGVLAGQVFKKRWKCSDPSIFAGPKGDQRSEKRVQGFLSVFPNACVTHSSDWHYESALKTVDKIGKRHPTGIFCANDRLAQAIATHYRARQESPPHIMGFDNAPISQETGLSTVAIPWEEFVDAIAELAERRLKGYNGTARRIVLAPRILFRGKAQLE